MDMTAFGERLRRMRRERGLTQRQVAERCGISEQAVSKWEHGAVLPDAAHLAALAECLMTSADCLLALPARERLLRRFNIGGAEVLLVEKPGMLLAGRIIRAGDHGSEAAFDRAIGAVTAAERAEALARVRGSVSQAEIRLSVNFWREWERRAYGFVRETDTEDQPAGVDVYRLPPSLYVMARNDAAAARLMGRERCGMWELFAWLRACVLPAQGLHMAQHGAQEMEVPDAPGSGAGWACLPVQLAE